MTTLIEFLRNEEMKYFTIEEYGRVMTYVKSPRKREGCVPYEVVFCIREERPHSLFYEKSELIGFIVRNQIITLKDVDSIRGAAGVFTLDTQMKMLQDEMMCQHKEFIESLKPNIDNIDESDVEDIEIRRYRFQNVGLGYQANTVFTDQELFDILTSEKDYKQLVAERVLESSKRNQYVCDMNEYLRVQSEKLGISDELVKLYKQLNEHKSVTVEFDFKGNKLITKMNASSLANEIRDGWYIDEYVFEGSKEKAREYIQSIGALNYLSEGNNLLPEHIVKVTHRHNVLFDINNIEGDN